MKTLIIILMLVPTLLLGQDRLYSKEFDAADSVYQKKNSEELFKLLNKDTVTYISATPYRFFKVRFNTDSVSDTIIKVRFNNFYIDDIYTILDKIKEYREWCNQTYCDSIEIYELDDGTFKTYKQMFLSDFENSRLAGKVGVRNIRNGDPDSLKEFEEWLKNKK